MLLLQMFWFQTIASTHVGWLSNAGNYVMEVDGWWVEELADERWWSPDSKHLKEHMMLDSSYTDISYCLSLPIVQIWDCQETMVSF